VTFDLELCRRSLLWSSYVIISSLLLEQLVSIYFCTVCCRSRCACVSDMRCEHG